MLSNDEHNEQDPRWGREGKREEDTHATEYDGCVLRREGRSDGRAFERVYYFHPLKGTRTREAVE